MHEENQVMKQTIKGYKNMIKEIYQNQIDAKKKAM